MTIRQGVVGAIRRERVASASPGGVDLAGSRLVVTIPGHGVVDAVYGGEPPPPLSTGWFRNEGGVWIYDGMRGHARTLLHDDFLHVGGRRGVTLTRSTNNNINNVTTYTTSWEAASSENPDGYWASGTPTVITIPTGQGGLYFITAVAVWTAFADFDAAIVFSVKASGAPLEYRLRPNGTPSSHSISVTLPLDAGDTFTIQWLNLSGGTRTMNEARVDVYRVDESDYGDTPWTAEFSTNASTRRVTAVTGAGDGVIRLSGSGTVIATSEVFLRKTDSGILVRNDRGHWLSTRVRISTLGVSSNQGVFIGFFDPSQPSIIDFTWGSTHWRLFAAGAVLTGVPAVAGEWVDFDLVVVGDAFIAAWINGSGPYIGDDTVAAGASYEPTFGLVRDPGDSDADFDVDFIRVVAFDDFALPAQLTPQVIEVQPG